MQDYDELMEQDAPAKPKRNLFLIGGVGCGALVALCVVIALVGVFLINRERTQLMEAAATSRAEGAYEAAIGSLETLISDHAESDEAEEARKLIPEIQLEWGKALRDGGEFEEALALYDVVRKGGNRSDAVSTAVFQTRNEWGDALIEVGDFEAALGQFETVLDKTLETTAEYGQARSGVAQAYIGRAEQFVESGDVPSAYSDYSYVFDNYDSGDASEQALTSFGTNMVTPLYAFAAGKEQDGVYSDAALGYEAITLYAPESPEAVEANKRLPEAYFKWARSLADEGEYEQAVETYELLLASYPDSAFVRKAEQGLVDARVAAVEASGTAGVLPPPQAASSASDGSDTATYSVENDTVCPILLLASGPGSQSLQIPAGKLIEQEFEPGTYNIVVQTDDSMELGADCQDIIPFTGESVFEGGYIYESSFYIE